VKIAGLQKTSSLDFPGCLAAVVFSPGCNYDCFYCHNRHILGPVPLLEESEVKDFLAKRAGLLDGVVFSGGEPTLDPGLPDMLRFVKALGYKTKLDTNGSRPEALAGLLEEGLLDYTAMDYKAPFRMYPEICRAEAEGIEESISVLEKTGSYELRTTLIPLLGLKELKEMSFLVPKEAKWALQLYRPQPGDEAFLKGKKPYTPSEIRKLAEELLPLRPGVFARC